MAYVETGNATEAYRRSYSYKNMKESTLNRNAKALMDNNKISARIEEIKEEIRKPAIQKFQLTKEWIIAQLVENVSISKAAEPVVSANGETSGEYKTNIPAANKALELLGKEIGMFVDKKEITGANGGAIKTESTVTMTPEDAYKAAIGKA